MTTLLHSLTPREIVAELDRYIVGQQAAKRAVALALRNRWRRQQLTDDLRDEVVPRNILMIGATGVGKTEIARRLARLAQAPFLKVEASKFTEVGYVGRDVESMIRDLVEAAITLVRSEHAERVRIKSQRAAESRLIDLLQREDGVVRGEASERDHWRRRLRSGELDDREVDVTLVEQRSPRIEVFSPRGTLSDDAGGLGELLGGMMQRKKRQVRMKAPEALRTFTEEEAERLLDPDAIASEALVRAQQHGIVFIDEIDKVAGREGGRGPEVSREGVQRDLLPIVEGSTVTTKHGAVKTDHILFIAAGAFHVAKPSDLIPELQGRFPIRVELEKLSRDDLRRILVEPRASLLAQYTALLATEGVELVVTESAIDAIARVADEVNNRLENIGARRLHTILERLVEEISFHAPEMPGTRVEIDDRYVSQRLDALAKDEDLSRYVL